MEFLTEVWTTFEPNKLGIAVSMAFVLMCWIFLRELFDPRRLERAMARKNRNKQYAQWLEQMLQDKVAKKQINLAEKDRLMEKVGRFWGIRDYIRKPKQRLLQRVNTNGRIQNFMWWWPIPNINISKTKAAIRERLRKTNMDIPKALAEMKNRRSQANTVAVRKEITSL